MRILLLLLVSTQALAALPKVYPLAALKARAATLSVIERSGGPKREGQYIAPSFGLSAVPRVALVDTFSPALVGDVYAQPLFVEKAIGGKDVLLIATEANHVYALDAANGQILWDRTLGKPVPHSDLPCGNIDPLGVTGTPIVDLASSTLLVDSMEYTGSGGTLKRHMLHRLSIKDGSEVAGWGFDVAEKLKAKDPALAFNAEYQSQRGALAIAGGMVYVPYGGHWGDCGDYHGWIVGFPLSSTDPSDARAWKTAASKGGSWAPGGVAVADDSVFLTTGNTTGASDWGGGEAILKFPLDLSFKNDPAYFFAPNNWKSLDAFDTDLGGAGPILIDLPQGANPKLAAGIGKDGNLYLVDRNRPGGIGGALLIKKVASFVISVPATYTTTSGTYVVFKGNGQGCPSGQSGDLTAIRITPALEVTTAWCAKQDGKASPIVTTTDGRSNAVVWGVGAEGSGQLHAFNGETGVDLVTPGTLPKMNGVMRFQAPIVVKDRLYVVGGGKVYVYSIQLTKLHASR